MEYCKNKNKTEKKWRLDRKKIETKDVIKRLALDKRIKVISRISIEGSIRPVGLSTVPNGLKILKIGHDLFPPECSYGLLILF
jgi:hypothetical protein